MKWHIIPTGRVWVDPGGALGLVPRPLWIKHYTPNEHQYIPMDLNSLLIFTDDKTILVDNGLGDKLPDKAVKNWGLEYPEGSLTENLAKHGLTHADIDIVIDTHLHSDHCGGNTLLKDENPVSAFPNATYTVQRLEFADAMNTNARTRATYLADNFVPVWENGQLELLHGDTEIASGVRVAVTPGHTRGHQSVILEDEEGPVIFISDLASYSVHIVRTAWVTAYDVEPLETIATKQRWQKWIVENKARIIFQHDVHTRMARMFRNDKGRFELDVIEKGSM